jgi:hypothetical protein
MKKTLVICLAFFAITIYAQRVDTPRVFVATTEAEMYALFNQMLDSARVSNIFTPFTDPTAEKFGFDIYREIENRDTLMKFEQWIPKGFTLNRFYWGYISNSMSIDFYGRFLDYLKQLDVIENYFVKNNINHSLPLIMRIIIRQYESGTLNEHDSIKARQLIGETLLRLINDNHSYAVASWFHEYVTDTIRQALIKVLENPFYPKEYLEFFMSQQDTLHLDTISIPPHLRRNVRWERRGEFTDEELVYVDRFSNFLFFDRIGREEFGGLSAGEAYLESRKRFFQEWHRRTGFFLNLKDLERYAHEKNDELLIKHIKIFKEKFPDYH